MLNLSIILIEYLMNLLFTVAKGPSVGIQPQFPLILIRDYFLM